MPHVRIGAMAVAGLLLAGAVTGDEFWDHWGDGRGEVSAYRLTQPRYGAPRPGHAVLVFVTEDFVESLRVKHEGGERPASDVEPVLKLNAIRKFQTGIYDYSVMTSTFARVADGWPVAKVSFSSQEWCGHVWHQLLPRGGRIAGDYHSYFEAEADGRTDLPMPEGAVLADAVPILVRGLRGGFPVAAGGSRSVAYLPSLLHARLAHQPLAWDRATISRAAGTRWVEVPAGRFEVVTLWVDPVAGSRVEWDVEAAPPHRIVGWRGEDGEQAALLGSARLPYWRLNGPDGVAFLDELGLAPVDR